MDTYPMKSSELHSGRYVCTWECLHSPRLTINFKTGGVWVRILDSLNEGKYTYTAAHPDCWEAFKRKRNPERHLGYANYLTASVALWIDNDSSIRPWVNRIADIYGSHPYVSDPEDAETAFAQWLREYVESTFPDLDGVGNIFLAVARDQVDWNELAERYINRER